MRGEGQESCCSFSLYILIKRRILRLASTSIRSRRSQHITITPARCSNGCLALFACLWGRGSSGDGLDLDARNHCDSDCLRESVCSVQIA